MIGRHYAPGSIAEPPDRPLARPLHLYHALAHELADLLQGAHDERVAQLMAEHERARKARRYPATLDHERVIAELRRACVTADRACVEPRRVALSCIDRAYRAIEPLAREIPGTVAAAREIWIASNREWLAGYDRDERTRRASAAASGEIECDLAGEPDPAWIARIGGAP